MLPGCGGKALLSMSRSVRDAYRRGQEDETLEPLVLFNNGKAEGRIARGDSAIFYNIRGEREIELTESLTESGFSRFSTAGDLGLKFATMIEYRKGLPVLVAFPPEGAISNTLSEVISRQGLEQVNVTEAEKAVHVSFFFGGKKRGDLPGREFLIVPTRKDVALFDEAPEMSIAEIADALIGRLRDPRWGFILANFPNVDVVGHIENKGAVIRAIEAVDSWTGKVLDEALRQGVTAVVTADHGTVEKWLYPDGAVDTGHTDSDVPFIIVGREKFALRNTGELSDIAPTVLELFGFPRPGEMTGRSLLAGGGRLPVKRILLLILDGWGYSEKTAGNLIAEARTPVMDGLMASYPWARLRAAGDAVGLPAGTVGNSEVGHLHIGAGRRIFSDRVRIDKAISDGSFRRNEAFLAAARHARETGGSLHLIGIVSFFSSHGSVDHLLALLDLAGREGVKNVFIHAMLGRRGEVPESGANYIEMIEKKTAETGIGRVVSVIGRYWSMDREENWDRIEKTYRMLVYGEGFPVGR
ncbi:MAG TPA: alkaline phosphatase family protein [Syntrophales bacterium]|nr:alkaline phosphatase family protein [Syntrophales bacterium]